MTKFPDDDPAYALTDVLLEKWDPIYNQRDTHYEQAQAVLDALRERGWVLRDVDGLIEAADAKDRRADD